MRKAFFPKQIRTACKHNRNYHRQKQSLKKLSLSKKIRCRKIRSYCKRNDKCQEELHCHVVNCNRVIADFVEIVRRVHIALRPFYPERKRRVKKLYSRDNRRSAKNCCKRNCPFHCVKAKTKVNACPYRKNCSSCMTFL